MFAKKRHGNQLQSDHYKQNSVQQVVDQLPDLAQELIGNILFINAIVANN